MESATVSAFVGRKGGIQGANLPYLVTMSYLVSLP